MSDPPRAAGSPHRREAVTTSLHHVAVVVRDLDQALAIYQNGLGLELDRIEDLPDRGVRVAFLRAGGTKIELVQPVRENSEVSEFLARRGEGLHHVAFRTFALEDAVRACSAAGAKPVGGDARRGAGGTRVAFLHPKTTGGVLIELVEESGEVHSPLGDGAFGPDR